MKLSNWNKSGEILSFISSICGLLAVIGLVGCAVLVVDHLPQIAHCCDDGGDLYYAPSGLMQFAAVVLFPITMLIGLIAGLFLGYWQISIATAILICAWIYLKGVADSVETEILARWRKEHQDTYDQNRGLR